MNKEKKSIVLVTGGFDPIHSGHLDYLNSAKKLGDELWVGVNSDQWLINKKGSYFMPYDERCSIIANLKCVDNVIPISNDHLNTSAIGAIEYIIKEFNSNNIEIIFANGGDRNSSNIPEIEEASKYSNVSFKFSVGGDIKKNSSSWILENWKTPKTDRPWGWYRVLDERANYKIKELVIEPGKSLSMQRHFNRSEYWYVLNGKCDLIILKGADEITNKLKKQTGGFEIPEKTWHKGTNPYSDNCHILEVQYGSECSETDIERLTP